MPPFYSDDRVTVHHGDCLDVLRTLPDCSVDSVVTDPPYGLGFMGKEWDGPGKSFVERAPARRNTFDHVGGNHNPKDSRDQQRTRLKENAAFGAWCEQWAAECLRVLRPGGHLLAFGGTRTWHRLACAVEDAGFEIRDTVASLGGGDSAGLLWMHGQGFPKSLDVSRAIDRIAGRAGSSMADLKRALRERFDASGMTRAAVDAACGFRAANYLTLPQDGKQPDPWVNVLPTAEKWAVIKRVLGCEEDDSLDAAFAAAEREVLGMRKVIPGVAFSGDGPSELPVTAPATDEARRWEGFGTALKPAFEPIVVARKPLAGTVAANVTMHGTGALNIAATRVALPSTDRMHKGGSYCSGGVGVGNTETSAPMATGTSRVREIPQGRWPSNVVLSHSPSDPEDGCEPGCPVAELDAQSGEASYNPPARWVGGTATTEGWGNIGKNEPGAIRGGYGDRGGASRFFPTFRYQAKAPTRERPKVDGVAHPCVKPVELMKFLCRLVTPPGGVVLDPFAGSGATAEAAILEGFRCITIEREAEYLPLILARIQRQEPAEAPRTVAEQMSLLDDPAA